MFSTRRLAKRSIVGTRICAPWTDDRFYPGVIQATQTWPNGEDVYTILFDDGYTKICQDHSIIGPGFQTISNVMLKKGQRVYLTLNGREISGVVVNHDLKTDDVSVDVSGEEVLRKLDDLRLMESRKSARLQDQDTDYSRLADVYPEPTKKRAVSSVIDVPAAKSRRHRKASSSSPDDREEEDMTVDDADMDEEDISVDVADRQPAVMNAHMAAMVLTSLSCSPVSPGSFPNTLHAKVSDNSPGTSGTGSSTGSSGVWGVKSDPGTPSPPQFQTSSSAPTKTLFESQYPPDEGIELDDSPPYFADDFGARKKRASVRNVFKCMWPGCGKVQNTISTIEKHVRQAHLSPKDDSDVSDHEEEFYYQEVEVTVDTVTQTFADMYTSSPPQITLVDSFTTATNTVNKPLPDHDYQKKDPKSAPLNIPSTSHHSDMYSHQGASYPSTSDHHATPMSRSWQFSQGSYGGFKASRSHDRLSQPTKSHSLSTSPKNSPLHKKSRSEVKKCRKVYGMENRDLWCTQCKWKKACTRFLD